MKETLTVPQIIKKKNNIKDQVVPFILEELSNNHNHSI